MLHDPSGQCSLRKMYTKQMFVLVRMQLRTHVDAQAVKGFKRYKGYAVCVRY